MAARRMRSSRRLRAWIVEQVSSGKYPGLVWDDDAETMIRIPWKHARKCGFRKDEDAAIFKAWAEFKGKLTDGSQGNISSLKTRLRCALNKSPEFMEVMERAQLDISEPYKVYRLVPISEQGLMAPEKKCRVKAAKRPKRRRSSSSSESESDDVSPRKHIPTEEVTSQLQRRKMCAVQLLRVSVHERISAAAEDFLLQVEKGEEAAEIPALRALLTERLTAAAEEIVGLFEETVAEYEDRAERSEREICRQRRLLDAVLKPEVKLHRADVQQQLVMKEEVPPEQREWSPHVDQDDPELLHIKEEEEEVWSSQEGEQLQGLEEADVNKFIFTSVFVKSEEDDEEKAQSSQRHQTQTEQMETDADGDGGSEPDRDSDPERHLQPVSEDNSLDSTETDDSDCDRRHTNKSQSGAEVQENSESLESDIGSSAKERPFPCSYCGKRFSLKGNLNRHIRDHTGERPFPCTGCDKSFKDSGSLTAHMRCHTGEQPYSCLFCGKNFSGRGNMTRHMRIHTGEKPFTCSMCNKSFHVKEHLNRHMKYHTGEKPFSCTVCGKGCAQKTDLKKHMRVHTGEKPFSCPFCGKCCAERGDLTKHMRVHTGEKPFSCNVCGKSCAQKGSLKIHMRVHTGEKPFSCSVCSKRFTVTGHLKRHMKLHTADSTAAVSADTHSVEVQHEIDTVESLNTS